MRITQQTSLFFKEGSSDKEYHIQMVEDAQGFKVNFQYGRRGQALKSGTKTDSPVSKGDAEKIYLKLFKAKTGDGYTERADGRVFSAATVEARITDIRLQLLNEIDEETLFKLLSNDDYYAQEKHDGERRGTKKTADEVIGINKKNLSIGLSPAIANSINQNGEFDAEQLGTENLVVFDILSLEGKDLKSLSYEKRLAILETVKFGKQVKVTYTAKTTEEKKALYKKLKAENAEGLVLRLKSAPYTGGRPNSGGSVFKYKFYKTATCKVVGQTKGKRSVKIVVFEREQAVEIGKVTVPPNKSIPANGAFIEVKYLYAYRGGSLFQPSLIRERNDVDETDAGIKQLVYRQNQSVDDEDEEG